ncbi:hypothetical protein E2C01_050573 [Portunus trituberculatus]|uniref:Uncharacterized protein n=1 Tax=Portunus trituberculatus TaxID=210409 RepID=A0A5B7GGI1_PORTR|nr:hypothetical protein [Portunus trituberculatus]
MELIVISYVRSKTKNLALSGVKMLTVNRLIFCDFGHDCEQEQTQHFLKKLPWLEKTFSQEDMVEEENLDISFGCI